MADDARHILAQEAGGLTDAERQRIERGDVQVLDAKLEGLEDDRSWLLTLTAVASLMAIVLPTAGVYKLFRAVNNFEPIELIGVIAAACLAAALLAIVPLVLYTNWTRRRLCYRALRAIAQREREAETGTEEPGKRGDEESSPQASSPPPA